MLKNSAKIHKGEYFEKVQSSSFHCYGKAVLVSPKFLRSRNMGQIDLCRYRDGLIELGEVKSSGNISRHQYLRLGASANILSMIFKRNSKIILIHAAH